MISRGHLIVVVLKRGTRGPWCRYLQHNPERTRHRYSPGSRRRAVEDHARMSEASPVGMVPTRDVSSSDNFYHTAL